VCPSSFCKTPLSTIDLTSKTCYCGAPSRSSRRLASLISFARATLSSPPGATPWHHESCATSIHHSSKTFTVLVRRALERKSPRKGSQRGGRTWDRAAADAKTTDLSLTIDVVIKFYLCLSSSSCISTGHRWALHRIPISSFVPFVVDPHASDHVSHGLIIYIVFLCARSWWTSHHIYAADWQLWSCHAAAVRTSRSFPPLSCQDRSSTSLQSYPPPAMQNLHVKLGISNAFSNGLNSFYFYADGWVTYMHVCTACEQCMSQSIPFYVAYIALRTHIYTWAIMIQFSFIFKHVCPHQHVVIICYLFIACSPTLHVCSWSW
jgi:hypothetical protein